MYINSCLNFGFAQYPSPKFLFNFTNEKALFNNTRPISNLTVDLQRGSSDSALIYKQTALVLFTSVDFDISEQIRILHSALVKI